MKILILYDIKKGTIKYSNWHDGFTKAIDLLKIDQFLNIEMININENQKPELNNYDIVFIKWGFGSCMQNYAIQYFQKNKKRCKLGIFISSIKIPTDSEIKLYDIMFYETEWYRKYSNLDRHKYIYHAFGIDTDIMKKQSNITKKYDYIYVGNISTAKSASKLLNKNGRRLAVGFKSDNSIINKFTDAGIDVIDFVHYFELSKLYNMSRKCYVPCSIDGGGERAVLEARACGLPVEIEENEKLKELVSGDIYDSKYYCDKIKRGIFDMINMNIFCLDDIHNTFKTTNLSLVQIGAMDGVTFDKSYNFIKSNPNIKAYLLEPVQYYFNKLVDNYSDSEGHIILINNCLAKADGKIDFHMIDPEEIEKKNLPKFLMGISSMSTTRNSLSEEYWETKGKIHTQKYGWTYENLIKNNIRCAQVNSICAKTLFSRYNIGVIDILLISAGGYEYEILQDFLQLCKPKYIKMECGSIVSNTTNSCGNSSTSQMHQNNLKNLLMQNNYKIIFQTCQECIALYLF